MPLKAGKVKAGGMLDFELPQVDEGVLLAELSEPDPGTPGTTVHGEEIAPPGYKAKTLLCAKGVTLTGLQRGKYR